MEDEIGYIIFFSLLCVFAQTLNLFFPGAVAVFLRSLFKNLSRLYNMAGAFESPSTKFYLSPCMESRSFRVESVAACWCGLGIFLIDLGSWKNPCAWDWRWIEFEELGEMICLNLHSSTWENLLFELWIKFEWHFQLTFDFFFWWNHLLGVIVFCEKNCAFYWKCRKCFWRRYDSRFDSMCSGRFYLIEHFIF